MCGILGAVGPVTGAIDAHALAAALDLLRHRGPDGVDSWRSEDVVLGHRRLAIVDLGIRAAQPMVRGDLVVAFNGEIYNFRILRDELSSLGHSFVTSSDTEVLAAAWQQWGYACLPRLEGMFALAIWDTKSRKLTLARDRFGEKPLFWLCHEDGLIFASEVPPIVRLSKGELVEDSVAIGLYFLFSYIPAPFSAFRDLHQLEPGCWLEWSTGGIEQGCYYSLSESLKNTLSDANYSTACAELRVRLARVVRDRVETADVPVASMLSGGIDSSIITVLAADVVKDLLPAYTLSFPEDPEFDESGFARDVAERSPKVKHRIIPASERLLLDFSDRLFDRLGEPFADSSLLPTTYLCAHIEEKVALGGDAADELFAGYGTYPAILRGANLPLWMRQFLTTLPQHTNPHAIKQPLLRAAALFHRHLRVDPVDSYFSWRTYADASMLGRFGLDTSGQVSVRDKMGSAGSGRLRDIQLLDLEFNLPNDMLKKVDYASMLNSIEVRLPYLDSGLTHWALSQPDNFRLSGSVRKRILRDAFADRLPESILIRGKKGFLLPIRNWFRAGQLRDKLVGLLEKQSVFDPRMIGEIITRHSAGRTDDSVFLWALYVYLRWQRNLTRWAAHTAPDN